MGTGIGSHFHLKWCVWGRGGVVRRNHFLDVYPKVNVEVPKSGSCIEWRVGGECAHGMGREGGEGAS